IDKLTNVLITAEPFDVKERVDLSALVDEKDLETAEIVSRTNVKAKLAGVRFVVIGGVTVSNPHGRDRAPVKAQ
ncbi:MAG TPA: CsgG/HfaB family protein, partial [Planctomycetota bacterium]|nr:CsgG/HfaB family protein [Planctomycetota bacterium]